jgi:magnesium-protoporphyrin IX monomethyl ester (oxidative) cyclase
VRIALVNMPFSSLQIPSIALHQLETAITEQFGGAAEVDVHYLNHDFGALVGVDLYAWISESLAGHTCGFGEWLFRAAAFPEAPDNTQAYFKRYAHHFGPAQIERYERDLAPVRATLPDFLDRVIDAYGLAEADVVGLTSMFFQNVPSFALARRIKERSAKPLVVMGGANCEGTMGIEIVNQVPWVDFTFSGTALISFGAFLEALSKGDRDGLHRINGVFSRRNSRSVSALANKPAVPGDAQPDSQLEGISWIAPERPLNEAVAVDYDPYLDSYGRHFGAHRGDEIELLFETSRGCWWGEKAHCTFCGLNGATMSFREMGVDQGRRMIEGMVTRYAGRVSRFASVDNIIPKTYITDLLPNLRLPEEVTLFYEVKADLTRDQIDTLAAARVREVQPGIESISTDTLKLMRKGTTAFNNVRFLADCGSAGIKPVWNLLVGFPGESVETYEMYRENLPRLTHLPPPSGVFPVRFDRFSPYFKESRAYQLDLAPLDYHEMIYPFPEEIIANMAYYFRDRNIAADYQRDLADHLAHLRDTVARWRDLWGREGGAPRLRLIEDDLGWLVEDSRSGHLVEHELGDGDVALLRLAEKPLSAAVARDSHGDSLDYLLDIGLLFQERGRVMSLVFEGLRHALDDGKHGFDGARGRAEAAALGLTF